MLLKFAVPKLILRASANKVRDSISGGGSAGLAHNTPANQKPSIASIFVHSSAGAWCQKKACQGQVGYS